MIENIQKQLNSGVGSELVASSDVLHPYGAQLSTWGKSQLVAAVFCQKGEKTVSDCCDFLKMERPYGETKLQPAVN